ncbi:MAG: YCF48-related protein [Bacteroidota bacterium]
MKKICVSFYLLLVSTFSFAQWTNLNSGVNDFIYAVDFTDTLNGYVSCAFGKILKTNNAGNTWTTVSTGTSNFLFGIKFTSHSTGYAAGEYGTLLKTTNAGANWNQLTIATTKHLQSFCFIDSLTGFVVGQYGAIFKTIDGGVNWTDHSFSTSEYLWGGIHFPSADTGYVMGSGGMILRSIDAGNTWTALNSGFINHLTGSCFTSATTGYAVGDHGIILKTTNAGITWARMVSTTTAYILSVNFTDANTGYAFGDLWFPGTINNSYLQTTDAGLTWTKCNTGTNMIGTLYASTFLNDHTAYAVGQSGKIIKTTNLAVSVPEKELTNTISLYPNPATNKLNISLSGKAVKQTAVHIYDLQGKELMTSILDENQTTLNVEALQSGLYFVKITTEQGSETKKLVIE